MSFYFKLAPGVRVRAGKRGIRVGVGPRAARVHVGAGRPGVSTGAGPVTLYRSMGGSRHPARRRSSGSSKATIAARQRELAQAAKLQEARQLLAAFEALTTVHRGEFPPAAPPEAPPAEPVDEKAILERHERAALSGITVFKRAARGEARRTAAAAADVEIAAERQRRGQHRAAVQAELDEHWQLLLGNDPDTVIATLEEAFEDNEAPAAAVGVEGAEVALVVLVPGLDVVPERMPERTQAGNLSLRKLTKATRAAYYAQVVCGHVIATTREAFAVAPGIKAARIVAVRSTGADAYGHARAECLLASRFTRDAFDGVLWAATDAAQVWNDTSSDRRVRQVGQAKELQPLDLTREPELQRLLDAVDLNELAT